jgi:hypothetical protein
MRQTARRAVVLPLLSTIALAGAVALGPLSCKSSGPSGKAATTPWVTIDENFQTSDPVEAFIKNDSATRNMLPVSIRNYGHDPSVLKRFKGSRFAGPNEGVLRMFYKGLEDWKVIDLKYKNEKKRDVERTVLYVEDNGAWTVADSGSLMK